MSNVAVSVIIGSTRTERLGPIPAKWIAEHALTRSGVSVDVIDLLDTPLPTILPAFGEPVSDETARLLQAVTPRLGEADAFIVVTPEYNHSFPSSLKNAIDWHKAEWVAKPVGFVSYGGVSGGLRAVEQLRPVFSELSAITIRNTLSFMNMWDKFDGTGHPKDPSSQKAADRFLDELIWWAKALKDTKIKGPYSA